ncbi:MAG: DUF4382 domain-containing protein [Candidatus Acidiferrales bacterium]
MHGLKRLPAWFLVLPLAIWAAGCGSTGSSSGLGGGGGQQQTASVFTIGTDASLPSVISCAVTVNSVTLYNGTNNILVMSTPQIVDFAQLSGLHQLLDLNTVPTGTYTSATVTIAAPTIGYINTGVTPPTITNLNGTLPTNPNPDPVVVPLAAPVTVAANDLYGVRMDFDIRKSLAVDGSGNITGAVNPVFEMALVNSTDATVTIDDFRGGVVGVSGPNSFTVQGPLGREWNVTTSSSTSFDTSEQVATFTTDGNTIVDISGTLDPVTHSIDATEVSVISTDKFLVGGLFTYVPPPSGGRTITNLYVRYELPAISGLSPGDITPITLNGTERYGIANISSPITNLLFGYSLLTTGQRVDVGGMVQTVNGVTTLTPHRVILGRQGQEGSWVVGSTSITSGNAGSFSLLDNGTAGILLPSPLTVLTFAQTNFINLSGLSALTGGAAIPIRVVGFILINPVTHQPVMVARSVEELTS